MSEMKELDALLTMLTENSKPYYKHDSDCCTFLGTKLDNSNNSEEHLVDVYICGHQDIQNLWIIRWGNEPQQYSSYSAKNTKFCEIDWSTAMDLLARNHYDLVLPQGRFYIQERYKG